MVRFNGADAVRTGDGLFSATTGNPAIPTWLGEFAFSWLFRANSENDKYARQIRSSGGIAVFVGHRQHRQRAGRIGWRLGVATSASRCKQRRSASATRWSINPSRLLPYGHISPRCSDWAANVRIWSFALATVR